MPSFDHKTEREKDLNRIKESKHPRKIVVAGPGTGKSFLFTELIKKKIAEGKSNFLAITFIGKLGDALANDLCGLAQTQTMHGFARSFVLQHCRNWVYYPKMHQVIAEDLKADGITSFEIGDENYVRRTKHYHAVGDADVVHYAIKICKKDPAKIPVFDLVLVDEYQDFNSMEAELVDILAEKNEIVIVGDDDQALYGFKGSSPSFIRVKYDKANTQWERFTLRFCSRCTEVLIRYFHNLVAAFKLKGTPEDEVAKRRIDKEYICYLPEKGDGKNVDSKANPKIHLIKGCPVGMIAFKVRQELMQLAEHQKINDALIIGEGQSCESLLKMVANQLKNYGFKNVDHRGDAGILPIRQDIVDAYKFLSSDEDSPIGWRILGNPASEKERGEHIRKARTLTTIISGSPSKLEKISNKSIRLAEEAIEAWQAPTGDASNANPDEAREVRYQKENEEVRREVLIRELKRSNLHLPRPVRNFELTICNILNSKGLGADVVFLIGFDQGKFPTKKKASQTEVYQMLVAVTRAKKRLYLVLKQARIELGDEQWPYECDFAQEIARSES